MRDEWFCSGPEGRYGPLTLGELKDALARHPHANDIYIWHESFPDWVRAGDIGEFDALQAAPEPAPPQRWMPNAYAMPRQQMQVHPMPIAHHLELGHQMDLGHPMDFSPRTDIGHQRDVVHYDRHHYEPEEEHYQPVRRRFSLLGLLVGLSLVALGCAVFYFGMVGELARVSEILEFDTGDFDASAGFFFFLAGIVILWSTRTKVKR